MSSATVPITQDVSDIHAPAPTVDSNSAAQTITSAVQAPSPDQQYQQAPAATTPTIDNSVSPQPLWRSILGGALVGLAHGGVMGALANAVQPRRFEQVQADAEQKRQ